MIEGRAHLIVSGAVQGVGFRAWTQAQAARLEISGWVRNRPDGTVEAVAEGGEEQLQKFIAALRQGPPSSAVDEVEVTTQKWTGEFSDFKIHRWKD